MLALGMVSPVLAAPVDALVSRCDGPFDKCGYVEKSSGRQMIPARFEVAEPFSVGLAFTVAPQFAKLRPDRGNSFAVGEGEDVYWIDAAGKRVKQPGVARQAPTQALQCRGGLRFIERAGLWGLEDDSGKPVIAPRYRALSCFENGVAWSATPGAKQWCPIGPNGDEVTALKCREVYYPVMITESYPEKFSPDPHESSVLWTRAWLDYLAGTRDRAPEWKSNFSSVSR